MKTALAGYLVSQALMAGVAAFVIRRRAGHHYLRALGHALMTFVFPVGLYVEIGVAAMLGREWRA